MLKYLLVALYFLALGFCGLVGVLVGHNEACASVQAEWRNDKCVRVVEEEVK